MEEEKRKNEIRKRLAKQKQDKNILLLGGASHLASHILFKLMSSGEGEQDETGGCRVTVVDSKDPAAIFINPDTRGYEGSPRITLKQVSPYDWEWLESSKDEYNVIINAWMVHDAVYAQNNPIDTVQRNVVQSQHFMNTLIKGQGYDGHLIICSTDKVYGLTGNDYVKPMKQKSKPIPETAELQPVGWRAVTRTSQELVQTGMAKAYGIPFICFRIGTTYGPWTPREKSIFSWVKSLLLSKPLRIFGEFSKDDSPAREWVNIADVSTMITFTALSQWPTGVKNEIYNLGADEKQPHFVQNISEMLKTVIRKGTPSVREGWREPGETMLRIWLDCSKIREKLLFLAQTEFIYAAARDTSLWIAYNELKWGVEQMESLKKTVSTQRQSLSSLQNNMVDDSKIDHGRMHLSSQAG